MNFALFLYYGTYQDVNEADIQLFPTGGRINNSIIPVHLTVLLLFTYSGGIVMTAINEFEFELISFWPSSYIKRRRSDSAT